jgi:ketosteroid isomerase-like protein
MTLPHLEPQPNLSSEILEDAVHWKSVVESGSRGSPNITGGNSQTELKMRFLFIFLSVISLAATTVAAQKPTSRPLSPTAQASIWEQELRDADLDFARQTAARRLEGWMSFFADDASIIHDGQTVTGKDALLAFYQPVFANKDFNLTWSPNHAEASKDGTLDYTYGEYEARNGTAISRGVYTTIWRKIDGHWKVVLDLGSAARAQPKPQN